MGKEIIPLGNGQDLILDHSGTQRIDPEALQKGLNDKSIRPTPDGRFVRYGRLVNTGKITPKEQAAIQKAVVAASQNIALGVQETARAVNKESQITARQAGKNAVEASRDFQNAINNRTAIQAQALTAQHQANLLAIEKTLKTHGENVLELVQNVPHKIDKSIVTRIESPIRDEPKGLLGRAFRAIGDMLSPPKEITTRTEITNDTPLVPMSIPMGEVHYKPPSVVINDRLTALHGNIGITDTEKPDGTKTTKIRSYGGRIGFTNILGYGSSGPNSSSSFASEEGGSGIIVEIHEEIKPGEIDINLGTIEWK